MKDASCAYCAPPDGKADVLAFVGSLEFSDLYVFKDQFHRGRCVLATRGHYEELHELEPEVYAGYMAEIRTVALAISELFLPDKINYALYGDTVRHVHMHIVPKYKTSKDWGAPFLLNPESKPSTDWQAVVELLRKVPGIER